jgi:putative NADPH-quinone reductase
MHSSSQKDFATMKRRIVIIHGHPDAEQRRYGHALADAYAEGAAAGGHEVRRIEVARLDFPLLRSERDWNEGSPTADIAQAQEDIAWANHVVILFPLWQGMMPALLKGFFEQVLRPGFALGGLDGKGLPQRLLSGRSARVIVTMGMPALAYRWYFRAHSVKSLERNVLHFCGISPVRTTLIGMVAGPDAARREKWLERVQALGREGK